jgi:serine/threonine-protein kinase
VEPSARTRIQELLRVASRLPAAARASFLERAEPHGPLLREEVLSLLAHDDGRGELAAAPLAEGAEIGGYRLLEGLAEVPPGRLYRACRRADHAQAALVVVAGPGPAAENVAAALAQPTRPRGGRDVPGLVPQLEVGATSEGRVFVAFEPVEGVPLVELGDALRLPLEARVELVGQVARVVERCHTAGLAPLGLMPWSALGSWSEEGPRVALLALDPWPLLALLDPEQRADAGLLAGLETSPPEALRGEPRGVACDVFALGALLFEAATGTPPRGLRRLAGQRTLREELLLASRLTPPRASERVASLQSDAETQAALRSTSADRLRAALRSGLDEVIARALDTEPDRRPRSAGLLADQLGSWRTGRRRPHGLLDAAQRLGRRLVRRSRARPSVRP